jgi:hypothetical protein
VKTVNGAEVAVSVEAEGVNKVNSAKLITAGTDIRTDNGVIQTIDTVLIPPAATAAAGAGTGNSLPYFDHHYRNSSLSREGRNKKFRGRNKKFKGRNKKFKGRNQKS